MRRRFAAVRARLSEAGITSFLDRAGLPAGQPWQPFLERELGRSGAVAVFLGQRVGSWQHREVQVALNRQGREHDFPVIPILLPSLDDEPKGFLALQTWIDMRAGTDDPIQLQNLIAAIRREVPEGAAAIKAAICPYRGLLPFREEDAAFFFGRDGWIADLAAKVQAHPLVAVVGRSGSGKSSLVFAGLFPALRNSPGGTTWDMLALRPGHEPLNALAEALSPAPEGATPAERIEKINADADRLRRGRSGSTSWSGTIWPIRLARTACSSTSTSGRSCIHWRRGPAATRRDAMTKPILRTPGKRRTTIAPTPRASSICCWLRPASGTAGLPWS
jgi:hypothetical protein